MGTKWWTSIILYWSHDTEQYWRVPNVPGRSGTRRQVLSVVASGATGISSNSSQRLISNGNQLRRHGNVRRQNSGVRNYYGRDLRPSRIIWHRYKRPSVDEQFYYVRSLWSQRAFSIAVVGVSGSRCYTPERRSLHATLQQFVYGIMTNNRSNISNRRIKDRSPVAPILLPRKYMRGRSWES